MRPAPALQRLLSRPSTLELLRHLVGPPPFHAPTTTTSRDQRRRTGNCRRYTSNVVAVADRVNVPEDHSIGGRINCDGEEQRAPEQLPHARGGNGNLESSTGAIEGPQEKKEQADELRLVVRRPYLEAHFGQAFREAHPRWKWADSTNWTIEKLEFESNIGAPADPAHRRLLDMKNHRDDSELIARLLEYRGRKYGMAGRRMFWKALKNRQISLPTNRSRSYRHDLDEVTKGIWMDFLELGFHDDKILKEICQYANDLLDRTQKRWPHLYCTIVRHFLLNGPGSKAVLWHCRLFARHPPTSSAFEDLCGDVVSRRGDLKALGKIYTKAGFEHVYTYGKIIPELCSQGDFEAARWWHDTLVANGDIPTKSSHAQPLCRYLAIYKPRAAIKVTRSLVVAGAPFEVSDAMNENVKISREMMNLVHGETFDIPAQKFDDGYVARWFATTWASTNLIMYSIHALGLVEIGPLSLQALCLRKKPDGSEPELDTIVRRLAKLQSVGISIGKSVYSRAVSHFAQRHMFKFLMPLLRSDQHPDVFEDRQSVETLLAHFAQIGDWNQYRRLLAIRTMDSKSPRLSSQNVWLQTHAINRNVPAMLDTLEQMQMNGTIVTTFTIAKILKTLLPPRRSGQKVHPASNEAVMAATILKNIMDAGNFVPAFYWREIINRIGMMKQNSELRELCIFLASRYGPTRNPDLSIISRRRANLYEVPLQIKSDHPLHPLRVLFPVSLQKSIVAWGFIQAFKRIRSSGALVRSDDTESQSLGYNDINRQFTAGITLLGDLRELGVSIDKKAMWKSIFDRLTTYYSPGRSNKLYNRSAREDAPELDVMRRLVEKAASEKNLKRKLPPGDGLQRKLDSRGAGALGRRSRKESRRRLKQGVRRVPSDTQLLRRSMYGSR